MVGELDGSDVEIVGSIVGYFDGLAVGVFDGGVVVGGCVGVADGCTDGYRVGDDVVVVYVSQTVFPESHSFNGEYHISQFDPKFSVQYTVMM